MDKLDKDKNTGGVGALIGGSRETLFKQGVSHVMTNDGKVGEARPAGNIPLETEIFRQKTDAIAARAVDGLKQDDPTGMPSQAIDALKTLAALNYTPNQVYHAYMVEISSKPEDPADLADANTLDDLRFRVKLLEKSVAGLKKVFYDGRKGNGHPDEKYEYGWDRDHPLGKL